MKKLINVLMKKERNTKWMKWEIRKEKLYICIKRERKRERGGWKDWDD